MSKTISRINEFYLNECRRSVITLIIVVLRSLYYKIIYGKAILPHPRTIIQGAKNIQTGGLLSIGLTNAGFVHKRDTTLINVRGSLILKGKFRIARGCRVDIGPLGKVVIEEGGYINANTDLIIGHSLHIGRGCVISWNCQFLDSDYHEIEYDNKKPSVSNGIVLGEHIWVGCGVRIYKGTSIPDGCVIAADSVVRGIFTEENALIGGNPAKILKSNVKWY
jgi:acetyltransferase-like isoleucine patch superfamily enzyme